MTIRHLTLAAVVVTLCAPALGRSVRETQLPNAPESCSTCHTSDLTVRNAFGMDVESTLVGTPIESATVDWMAICNLDSDDDGEDNGAELGDPCCEWTSGDAPLENTGLPGDPEAQSGNTCVDGVATAPAVPDPSNPGGPSCPLGGGGGEAALAVIVLGALRLRRLRVR